MRRYFLLICLTFALIIGSNALWIRALAFPTQIKSVNGDSVKSILLPDWEQMGFSSFPAISSSGSVNLKGEVRSWKMGDTPDQYLQMGDVEELRPDLLTLDGIEQGTSVDYSQSSLADFALVRKQTVARLAQIVPELGNRRVKDIPPLKALFLAKGGKNLLNQRVKVVAKDSQMGQLKLNKIDLSSYPISSIPNLEQVPLGEFEDWNKAYLKEVTGLKDLPLAFYPMPLSSEGSVARIDGVWGSAEKRRERTVSGGYKVGFQVPCQGQKCPYIELDDLENAGRDYRASFEGKSWISGKYQKVSGGSGCLAGVNGGKEPTGRHPFGKTFKVSVEEPVEATNQVDTAMYFRFSNWCGKTPYFIGPIPFITYKVGNGIFLGTNKDSSSEVIKANSSVSEPLSQATEKIEVKRIAQAIALLSEASYSDVSPVIRDGTHKGRFLGRYGFLSYAPIVVKEVGAMEGGTDWLNRLSKLQEVSQEEMQSYFPPALQEELLLSVLKEKLAQAQQEIDPQTGELLTGERLLERVASKYAFGDAVLIDGAAKGNDSETIQSFGKKVKDNYLALR